MALASADTPTFAPPLEPQRRAANALVLRDARERDRIGDHIAFALAIIYLFLLPLATAPKDWAFGLLVVWTAIRLPHTWRAYAVFLRMPIVWASVLWVGWQATSFLWSSNLEQAWDEIKVQRMLVTPLLLWPIIDRAPILVLAALGGVVAQNGVQVLQELGVLAMPMAGEGRLRGLIHPIHSGMWFGVALIWHLSAALHLRGSWRWISLAALLLSAAGLIATGSRGPWLATFASLVAALLMIPLRRPQLRRPAVVMLVLMVCAFLAAWMAARPVIEARLRNAREEITAARQHDVHWTSTGLRIGLWRWACQVAEQDPVIGVGAGDFPAAYQALPDFQNACDLAMQQSLREETPGYDQARDAAQDITALRGYKRGLRLGENRIDYLTRDHAHSTYLQTLASQGSVGLALLVAVLLILFMQCWRDPADHPYSDGMLFALLCWIIGAQFDCYEMNGHQLGLLAFICALTLPARPPASQWPWSMTQGAGSMTDPAAT